MDQRALLASALVLGCLAAAGAGGYLAVRQMTPVAASTSTAGTTTGAPSPNGEVPGATAVAPGSTPRIDAASAEDASASRRQGPSLPVQTAARSKPAAPVAPPPMAAPRSTPPTVAPSALPGVTTPSLQVETAGPARPGPYTAGTATSGPGSYGAESIDDSPLPSSAPVAAATTAPESPRRYELVTIPANAVIGIQMDQTVSTETANVEDRVRARVTRDLVVDGDVVVPKGARVIGHVVLVEEGGRVKERARLGLRFHTLVLSDGTEVSLPTEIVYRDGDSPVGRSAKKIGGAAIGGAVLGAIMGGGKGAAIGAATGAGSGAGWAMTDDRQPAVIRAGQSLTVRLSDSATTHVER